MESRLKAIEAVLFIDRKGRRYLKRLIPGRKILIRGEILADDLVGVEEGSRVKFSSGETFLVLRPTYADLIPHLPRQAQVIYPKDTGPLLIWGDVFPGATVIAWIWLGQQPRTSTLIGLAVLLIGVAVVVLGGPRPSPGRRS